MEWRHRFAAPSGNGEKATPFEVDSPKKKFVRGIQTAAFAIKTARTESWSFKGTLLGLALAYQSIGAIMYIFGAMATSLTKSGFTPQQLDLLYAMGIAGQFCQILPGLLHDNLGLFASGCYALVAVTLGIGAAVFLLSSSLCYLPPAVTTRSLITGVFVHVEQRLQRSAFGIAEHHSMCTALEPKHPPHQFTVILLGFCLFLVANGGAGIQITFFPTLLQQFATSRRGLVSGVVAACFGLSGLILTSFYDAFFFNESRHLLLTFLLVEGSLMLTIHSVILALFVYRSLSARNLSDLEHGEYADPHRESNGDEDRKAGKRTPSTARTISENKGLLESPQGDKIGRPGRCGSLEVHELSRADCGSLESGMGYSERTNAERRAISTNQLPTNKDLSLAPSSPTFTPSEPKAGLARAKPRLLPYVLSDKYRPYVFIHAGIVGVGATVLGNISLIYQAAYTPQRQWALNTFVSLMAVGNFLGRILSGFISQWVPPKNFPKFFVFMGTLLSITQSFLFLFSPMNDWCMAAVLMTATASLGCVFAIGPAWIMQHFPKEHFATLQSLAVSAAAVATSLLSVFAGHWYEAEARKQSSEHCVGAWCFFGPCLVHTIMAAAAALWIATA